MPTIFAAILWSGLAFAAVPTTMTYQGRLNDAEGNPINATILVTFGLYPSIAGGSSLWSEGQWVTVQNGVFNVVLGNWNTIPSSVVLQNNLYLGVQINADAEMTPRQKVNSSAFAMKAGTADAVENAGITSNAIADNAVTNAAIAPGAVTTAKITDSAVTDAKITSISAGKVTGALSDTKLSSNVAFLNNTQTISGTKTFSAPIISSVATGVAPLQVASQTMVTNLNVGLLDGQHAGDIIAAAKDEKRTPISSLPFTITSSGSYYLIQNLASSGNGILVNADNVTIDLNGFTLSGQMGSAGISMNGRSNVEIKNGTVAYFSDGIQENATDGKGRGHKIINVRSLNNTRHGMFLVSSNNRIMDCYVSNNGGYGISADGAIINVISTRNSFSGIRSSTGSTIVNCIVTDNTENGITTSSNSVVTGNTAAGNGTFGIYTEESSLVTGNIANNNGYGIVAGNASTIRDNTVYDNGYGIGSGDYCVLVNNMAYSNAQNIVAGTSCVWADNVAP